MTFYIPTPLREFTGGQSKLVIEDSAATLADAVAALWTRYPGLRERVTTEEGQIRQHINLFIGDENIQFTGGLTSRVCAESEISIVPAISGGCQQLIEPGVNPMPRTSFQNRRKACDS